MQFRKTLLRPMMFAVATASFAVGAEIFAGSGLTPAYSAPAGDGAIISQVHNFYGRVDIWLTPNAMKAVCNKCGAVVIARAPQWNVVIVNAAKKVSYETSLKNWSETGLFSTIGAGNSMDLSRLKGEPEVVCGLNCLRIKEDKRLDPERGLPPSLSAYGRKVRPANPKGKMYWLTTDVKCTPERLFFIRGLFKMSLKNSLLVRQKMFFTDGREQTELDTTDFRRQSIGDSQMQYPDLTGYRRTTKVEEVAQSNNQLESLEELFDGVSTFGSAESKRK